MFWIWLEDLMTVSGYNSREIDAYIHYFCIVTDFVDPYEEHLEAHGIFDDPTFDGNYV